MTAIGICKYCGSQKIVEISDEANEEMICEKVSAECDCFGARIEREKLAQREACMYNIQEMLQDKHPEVAELFGLYIEQIQSGLFSKITVHFRGGKIAKIENCAKGIKVSLENKKKVESLA